MGMFTYLNESEQERFTSVSDRELNDLFQEVRQTINENFLLREIHTVKRRWFRKPKTKTLYELYYVVWYGRIAEVQVINFCRDWTYSINPVVPKSYIMTYFFGLLAGKRNSYPNPERSVAPVA